MFSPMAAPSIDSLIGASARTARYRLATSLPAIGRSRALMCSFVPALMSPIEAARMNADPGGGRVAYSFPISCAGAGLTASQHMAIPRNRGRLRHRAMKEGCT